MEMEFYNRLPKYMWDLVIFPRLGLKDLIRLGAVSHSWRSIAAEVQRYLHPLPWLMISRDVDTKIGTFYSLSESKIYNLKLPELEWESYCCGSSQGFFIVANWKNNFIFNPFSQTRIDLPRQYVSPKHEYESLNNIRFYFKKAIILSTFDTSNVVPQRVVVSGLSAELDVIEMCTSQDPEWAIFGVDKEERIDFEGREEIIYLDSSSDDDDDEEEEDTRPAEPIVKEDEWLFSDILFYKGMLYGLTQANGLVRFEFTNDLKQPLALTVLNVHPMSRPTDAGFKGIYSYLVESRGELLMVYRYGNPLCRDSKGLHITEKFLVYKLDQSSDPLQWVQLQSLGDQMLFLGRSSSMSFSAASIPGFKGNCIYFTDDAWPYFFHGVGSRYCNSDNGIFYLDDGHIESFFKTDDSYSFNLSPVWVAPNWISRGKSDIKQL
ncbi:hypothetical protein FRX31_005034 [Thalictrum thalictroides]|uniref:KIB1-4 beta-propeller domain-containing protein n=1 Tax=Thalictrum thalictroides TaxID=46969 RepID=A0A7J6X6K7_THATH|nr:hypothetical protein FRX31_005034 [Thalictrum thalictroides]